MSSSDALQALRRLLARTPVRLCHHTFASALVQR
jgi:hypothetical protein